MPYIKFSYLIIIFSLNKSIIYNFIKNRLRILNTLEPGMFPLLMKTGFASFNAIFLIYLFKNNSFNKRSLALFGGIFSKKNINIF